MLAGSSLLPHTSSLSGLGEVPGQLMDRPLARALSVLHCCVPLLCFGSSNFSTEVNTVAFFLLLVNSESKCVSSDGFNIF